MNQRLQTAIDYLVARLTELSTWQGVLTAATAFGASMRPDKAMAIAMVGAGVFAAISAVFPDKFRQPPQ